MIAPRWPTIELVRVLLGRAAHVLGRLPTPQLATALFESVIRPRLGGFRIGTYGIGTPGIGELAKKAVEMQRVQPDGSIHIGRRGPNLILRFRHGDLPLYAALVYDDEAERDRASERLEGMEAVVWDREFSIVDDLRQPMLCVPSLRFFLAAELLRGGPLFNPVSGPPSSAPTLEPRLSLDDEMAQRAATLSTVRELCSPSEVLAYGLEEPIGYLYGGDEAGN